MRVQLQLCAIAAAVKDLVHDFETETRIFGRKKEKQAIEGLPVSLSSLLWKRRPHKVGQGRPGGSFVSLSLSLSVLSGKEKKTCLP